MGAEGLQDVPDKLIFLVAVESFVRVVLRGDADGQDDVAVFFVGGAAHDAAD